MRKHNHAYYDFSATEEKEYPRVHSSDEKYIAERLAQAKIQPNTLVNQIPQMAMPTTLSIGGVSREPIPQIPEERRLAQDAVHEGIKGVFGTFQHACPPPADTIYEVEDQGVSGPDFFRLSMYNVPATEQLRESTSLPLALYIRPFARAEVPLADFTAFDGENMPPRCRRCRAYMNPSMRFTHGGAKFVCNMCLFENRTPQEYYQPTNFDNKRIDWMERPELAYGTYEFVVSSDQNVEEEAQDGRESHFRGSTGLGSGTGGDLSTSGKHSVYGEPGIPFRHVFCCETSRDAIQKGVVEAFVTAIKDTLPYIHGKIAIITFDSRIVHYRRGPELLVSSPCFSTFPPDAFLDVDTQKEDILKILDLIPKLGTKSTTRQSCVGDAIATVNQLTDFAEGGRVSAFMSMLPNAGTVRLVPRDKAVTGMDPDPEKTMSTQLFNATSRVLADTAAELAANGWGCDMLVIPSAAYIDLANISLLPRETGGRLHFYPRFNLERDERRVIADLMAIATSPVQARKVQARLRTSTGLQVSTKFKDAAESWGFMDSDSTWLATCSYDSKLDAKLDAHFQVAILYTAANGERRLRVCNQLAGVTSKVKAILKYVDVDVVSMAVVKQTLSQLGAHALPELRAAVLAKLNDIFASVRKLVGYGVPESQLLMPTNLRMLPMYLLAFAKSIAIGPRAFSIDGRVADAFRLAHANTVELSLALYPRIYAIDPSAEREPPASLARFDELELLSTPVLVFDGHQLYLWISKAVPPSILEQIFGVQTLADVSPWLDEVVECGIGELSASLALRVFKSWVPLQIVRQGLDGAEYQIRQLMVEDATGELPAYIAFVVKVHEHAKSAQRDNSWF